MWWSIFFLLLGAGITAFVLWVRNRNIKITWYEWLIGVLGLLLLLFAIQNLFGGFAEGVPNAGWLTLLVFGLPALILLAVAWQLAARRHRAAG